MREMLFRGKPISNMDYYEFSQIWSKNCKNGFVYGSLIVDKNRYYICVSSVSKINCCINNGTVSVVEVIPETVGEYTVLTDKNGKKIFEGDIVKWCFRSEMSIYEEEPIEENIPEFHYDVVVYMAEKLDYPAFDLENNIFDCNGLSELVTSGEYDLEVIGNIHDNPELLKSYRMQ